jgi:hypothetical protein
MAAFVFFLNSTQAPPEDFSLCLHLTKSPVERG